MSERRFRRCRRCGRNRRIGVTISGRGIPTCRPCTKAHKAAVEHERWLRLHPEPNPCRDCGKPKPRGGGRVLCDECRLPRRYCGDCEIEIPLGFRFCTDCAVEHKRAANRRWNKAHRETLRAANRRWKAANRERYLAAQQAWYDRLRADPVAYQRYLEDHRISWRMRAEREGRSVPLVSEERYAAPNYHWRLPAAPLRDLVRARVSAGEHDALADVAGVPPRLLYRLLHEGGAHVSVVAADKIVTALGLHLHLLYESEAA